MPNVSHLILTYSIYLSPRVQANFYLQQTLEPFLRNPRTQRTLYRILFPSSLILRIGLSLPFI